MTSDQFKQIVRGIVKEEVEKILPTLIPQILSEAFGGSRPAPQPKKESTADFFESLKAATTPQVAKQKAPKKFSSNPLLNEILNETEGGIPPDVTGYGQGMGLPPMQKMGAHPMNVQQAQPLLNETTKAQAQIGAFKDYRALMKTIDKKKKEGFMGGSAAGFSIEGGIPNDFSTID
jgi:hypothetical protein